jgi:hypothetical protein
MSSSASPDLVKDDEEDSNVHTDVQKVRRVIR